MTTLILDFEKAPARAGGRHVYVSPVRWMTCALGLTLALSVTSPAHAWNNKGHMMVAFVAYEQLTPVVKDRVDHLLALNPLHDAWVSMMPDGTTVAETKRRVFMLAATWPDLIKTDPAHIEDGIENGNRPTSDLSSSQNIGYADMLRHRYWHFVLRRFQTTARGCHRYRRPTRSTASRCLERCSPL